MGLLARRILKVLLLAALLAYQAVAFFGIRDQGHPAWAVVLTGVPHAVAYAALLWVFARTLNGRQEALITRIARRVHGSLPPLLERYTYRLTAVWCVFFAAQLITSFSLLAFNAIESWSLFVHVLNVPLVGTMFIGDYLYRVWRYRGYPQASIAQAIQAFVRHKPFS